jgi:GH25 family lysozyme M1 (1,4-beta-N-acetylmuramidase)
MLTKLPDVSEFQGEVDFNAMVADGAPGFMIRASYGTATGAQKDARFDENWQKAKATGKPVFAYHFAYPDRSSGAVQARGFMAIVGQFVAKTGAMLDLEDGGVYGRPINASDDAWSTEFINTVKSAGPLSLSYMNTSTKNRFGANGWAALRATNSALMEANYGVNDGVSHGFPAPAPWAVAAFHQYTSRGTIGGRYPIDLSEFAGDDEALAKFVMAGDAPAPSPAPTPTPTPPAGGNGTSYTLGKNVPGYTNAADAAARKNSNSTAPAGTYFIYNQAAGMINVSRSQGVPGWWINPGDNVAPSTPAPAPSGHFTVAKPIPGFYTAANAAAHSAQANTVQPGDYFVFNTASGMVNVTSKQGVPGSWINPADNSGGGTNSGNSDGGSTFNLGHQTPGYVNAGDAAAHRNSNSTVGVGTYSVFNRAQGMVNITRQAGQPGWWIDPAA